MANKLTPEHLTLLKNTKSIDDWNAACATIKAANDGNYPSDWWSEVMSSGLANDVMASWPTPGSTEITAEPLDIGELSDSLPPSAQLSALNALMAMLLGGGPQGVKDPVLTMPVDPDVPLVYNSDTKEFPLADILSVTLGFLFDNQRGMLAPHGVMHFLMGGGPPLNEIEMQTFQHPVSEAIYDQHPLLRDIEHEREELMALRYSRALVSDTIPFLERQYARYGKTITLKFVTK